MRARSFKTICMLAVVLLPFRFAWCASITELVKTPMPDGPLWQQGKLLYVVYPGQGGVKVWDGKRAVPYWEKDHCGPTALIEFGNHHLLVACYDANAIVELDQNGKQLRSIERDDAGKPFIGPNDFAADGAGGIYLTASGAFDLKAPITGAILHISADGRHLVEVANTIHYSNGLTVAKDRTNLLVAEMFAGRILSFPINKDGSLGQRSVWVRLQDLAPPTPHEDGYNGPDALKLGPDGNYYIAHNGSGRVLVVNADRKLIRIIKVPTLYVTNVAFGPKGADTIYITGGFDQYKEPFPGAVFLWTR
jgi:sugar lactone lactonase YvrE